MQIAESKLKDHEFEIPKSEVCNPNVRPTDRVGGVRDEKRPSKGSTSRSRKGRSSASWVPMVPGRPHFYPSSPHYSFLIEEGFKFSVSTAYRMDIVSGRG
jgi:hypothetical protein